MRSHYVLSAAWVLVWSTALWGQTYTFTRVADISGEFREFGSRPSINNSGVVAFHAYYDVGLAESILVGAVGGPLTPVAHTSGPFSGFRDPALNSAGVAAFYATLDSGGRGIFAGTGSGSPMTVADTTSQFTNFGIYAAINDSGAVGFEGFRSGGFRAIYRSGGVGGSLTPIVDNTGAFTGFGHPFVRSGGTVVVTGYGNDYTAIVEGDGGQVTTVVDSTSGLNTTIDPPSANSTLVASRGGLDSGGAAIFTTSGGNTFATIADSSGPWSNFGDGVSVNASGQLAFYGTLDSGAAGIFTGPDPVADKVVGVGDVLGGTITGLNFYRGLNDLGQIVFRATYGGSGDTAIWVATPVPEPACLTVVLASFALCLRPRATGHRKPYPRVG